MYCSVDEVASDFKDITFSANSSVTISEVEAIISQESAFIDSMICSRYSVPVIEGNSPGAFLVLKKIAIQLSADRVRHILYVKTGSDNKDQDTKGLRSLSRHPRTDLQRIQDGTMKLCDAVALEECVGFDVGSDVPGCDSRMFDVSKQQW